MSRTITIKYPTNLSEFEISKKIAGVEFLIEDSEKNNRKDHDDVILLDPSIIPLIKLINKLPFAFTNDFSCCGSKHTKGTVIIIMDAENKISEKIVKKLLEIKEFEVRGAKFDENGKKIVFTNMKNDKEIKKKYFAAGVYCKKAYNIEINFKPENLDKLVEIFKTLVKKYA